MKESMGDDEAAEGIAAFFDKRPAVFWALHDQMHKTHCKFRTAEYDSVYLTFSCCACKSSAS